MFISLDCFIIKKKFQEKQIWLIEDIVPFRFTTIKTFNINTSRKSFQRKNNVWWEFPSIKSTNVRTNSSPSIHIKISISSELILTRNPTFVRKVDHRKTVFNFIATIIQDSFQNCICCYFYPDIGITWLCDVRVVNHYF